MTVRTVQYDTVPVAVNIPEQLASTLDHIASVQRGRFAFIENHMSGVSDPKCVRPTVSDITAIIQPRYDRWLERMRFAVTDATFTTFVGHLPKPAYDEIKTKLKGADMETAFNTARGELLRSLTDSQSGYGEGGQREAHRLCYASATAGEVSVKLHLVTEDDGTGHKRPVAGENGLMTVNSVMLPFYIVNRKVKDPGFWNPTNSRPNTLLKDNIERQTKIPPWKAFSLGQGNFTRLTVNGTDIYGLVHEELVQVVDPALDAVLAYIGGFEAGFLAALDAFKSHPVTV